MIEGLIYGYAVVVSMRGARSRRTLAAVIALGAALPLYLIGVSALVLLDPPRPGGIFDNDFFYARHFAWISLSALAVILAGWMQLRRSPSQEIQRP